MAKISALPASAITDRAETDQVVVVAPAATTTRRETRGQFLAPVRLVGPDWRPSVDFGPELWTLANFQGGTDTNTSTLNPQLVANGVAQALRTRVEMTNLSNRDLAWRLKFRINSLPSATGWAMVSVLLTDNAGAALTGSVAQTVMTNSNRWTGDYILEFRAAWNSVPSTGARLELRLDVGGNCPSGTLQITNASFKQITHVARPLFFSESALGAPGYPQIWFQLKDNRRDDYVVAMVDLASDNILERALVGVTAYPTAHPWSPPWVDPRFEATSSTLTQGAATPGVTLATGSAYRLLRSNNNDQIIEVLKQDGTTYELRCNTHGGESLRSTSSPDLIFEYDLDGSGTWVAVTDPFGKVTRTAMRFRMTWNSKVARSAPDSDDFANVDHRTTFFRDGVMRTDRTTTFLKSLTLRNQFEWMTSHDVGHPMLGRIGKGLHVIGEVDTFVRLAAPAAPSMSTNTSGGTLAAGTYWYYVTAITEGGETTPSPIGVQITTGSTSVNTITWSLITGATGYRVYGRANTAGRAVLLATVAGGLTSWDDDGSAIPTPGAYPPIQNTARRMDQNHLAGQDAETSGDAHWMVWRDIYTGVCHATVWDREAMLARAGVAGYKCRIEHGNGLKKTYVNLAWTAGALTTSVTSSTVWTATHWHRVYVPCDDLNWHLEAALMAADLSALKAAYPAT